MQHKISQVIVRNYKSIVNAGFLLSSFTPLVGYNNAGKSNCLSAIQWLLRKSSLPESSFYNCAAPVEVEATVEGISDGLLDRMPRTQKTAIERYLHHGKLKVRRLQEEPSARAADIKISVWNFDEGEWVANPTGLDNAIGLLFPEPIRIGAMENAAEDAAKSKTSTTIGKLLSEFLKPVKDAHEVELNEHLNEVGRRIAADGDQRFTELDTIDESVNDKVRELFPGMSVKLHFETPKIDDLIKAGTLQVFENQGVGRDFSSYGHGAQRSIQMALVQHLAEVKRSSSDTFSTTLLLIDEPELYLHPFAIEQVREALVALSKNGYQVIITTHSAQMITSDLAEHTLLIRKNEERGTYSRLRLVEAIQAKVPNSTHQMEQLFNLSHSCQVLFAENVILTEGKTELRLLPLLYKSVANKTMGQEKYALIAQSGVNDTKKSLEILQAMDLPARAICDLDYCFTGAIKDNFLAAEDEDLYALKQLLSTMAENTNITLNGNGLPKNNNDISAARAFEMLATTEEAKGHILSLHNKMKIQNIWIWKKGAIEAHIGTNSNDEREWARFRNDIERHGVEQTCSDYRGVVEMVLWLRE